MKKQKTNYSFIDDLNANFGKNSVGMTALSRSTWIHFLGLIFTIQLYSIVSDASFLPGMSPRDTPEEPPTLPIHTLLPCSIPLLYQQLFHVCTLLPYPLLSDHQFHSYILFHKLHSSFVPYVQITSKYIFFTHATTPHTIQEVKDNQEEILQ